MWEGAGGRGRYSIIVCVCVCVSVCMCKKDLCVHVCFWICFPNEMQKVSGEKLFDRIDVWMWGLNETMDTRLK